MNLADIATMDRRTLESLWQKHLSKVPMPNLNLRTLRGALAYEWQVKGTGGISKRSAQILRSYLPKPTNKQSRSALTASPKGKDLPKTTTTTAPTLTPGTVLVREWNGRRYQVNVLADGFEMDGRTYASLSIIAKTITGTSWSGPRFFGLVKVKETKKTAERKERGHHA